jgi:hypothetical protein
MKTTVEISDPLLRRARRLAHREGQTLRSLIESGLSRELAERERAAKPFKLRPVTFGKGGLRPEVAHLSMHELILMSYEDRD